MRLTDWLRRAAVATMAMVLFAACSGSGPNETLVVTSATASPTASPTPLAATRISSNCSEQHRCELEPGTYIAAADGFIPNMTFVVPIAWSSREHWQSELELNPLEPADIGEVRMWIDMAPSENGSADPNRQFDAAGWVDWITGNPELVVSDQRDQTVAGEQATVIDWTVSPDATSGVDDTFCPAGCAMTVGRPHVNCCIGYGPAEHVREYILDVGPADERHTLIIDLDSPSSEALDHLDELLQPVLAGLTFPETFTIWCGRNGPDYHDCSG